MAILLARSELNLHTRCENQVANELSRMPGPPGVPLQIEDYKKQFPNECHRPVASSKYNCHGLTFASRRTWIHLPTAIATIIKDDDYEKIDVNDVLAGDIAIYYKDGDVEHSGIVVGFTKHKHLKIPILLSKWGHCQEVIHSVAQSPFDARNVIYYRINL